MHKARYGAGGVGKLRVSSSSRLTVGNTDCNWKSCIGAVCLYEVLVHRLFLVQSDANMLHLNTFAHMLALRQWYVSIEKIAFILVVLFKKVQYKGFSSFVHGFGR